MPHLFLWYMYRFILLYMHTYGIFFLGICHVSRKSLLLPHPFSLYMHTYDIYFYYIFRTFLVRRLFFWVYSHARIDFLYVHTYGILFLGICYVFRKSRVVTRLLVVCVRNLIHKM